MRSLLLLIAVPLPGLLKRVYYRRVMGWRIGARVRIGLSYLDAAAVEIGDDARIGHFNAVRHVRRLVIGPRTWVSNLNTVTGTNYTGPGWTGSLLIGGGCSIMSRHFIDVAGTVTIGPGTTLAGRDTHLWSHTLRVVDGDPVLTPADLTLGAGCYVGARSTILFCSLPDGCFVGAGSVVTKSFPAADGRIVVAGNPATVRKVYPPAAAPPG